jgi:voltage-gated potassium channel
LLRWWIYSDTRKIIIEEFDKSVFLEKKFDVKKVLKEIFLNKLSYVISPSAIIDLLAILPAYRELRLLRVFVLFRVFKLLRYSRSISQFLQVIASKKVELATLFVLMAFVVSVAGISLYVFEHKINPNISSIFEALYWALVTISTVGFGDITPVTTEGRAITMVIIISGIGMISFATSIIVSAFNEKMHEIKESRSLYAIDSFDKYYLICGYSKLGHILAQKFTAEKKNFVIVDKSEDRIEEALSNGYFAIKGDASNNELLFKLGLERDKIKAIISLAKDDLQNIFIILNARSISKDVIIITRATRKESYKKLRLAGADYIVSPYDVAGLIASKILRQPVAVEALMNILSEKKNAVSDEIEVVEGSFLDGKTIEEINFYNYNLILLAIVKYKKERLLPELRKEFMFNPSRKTVLKPGDILIIAGYNISIAYFKNMIIESSIKL